MKFIALTSSLSNEWDNLVRVSDDAWVFHLYDWLELEEKVWDLEPKSFLVEHDGRTIGIVPLQMHKRHRALKSDFRGCSGVALINGLDGAFRERALKEIYQHIELIAKENNSPSIEIYLPPLAESQLKDPWQVNPLILHYYTDISTHTFILDLKKDQEAIIAGLSKDARLQMRKAQDSGYTIRQATGVEGYYQVHCENYRRTGVDPHPKEYFVGIFEKICKAGHAQLWEALDPSGEPVAFEMIAFFKKKAFYWTACCKDGHLESGVNYLLQIHSMIWAHQQGAQYFETGEAFPNAREGKEKGLTIFKEKFGGQLHRFLKGRLVAPGGKANAFKSWVQASKALLNQLLLRENAPDVDTGRN